MRGSLHSARNQILEWTEQGADALKSGRLVLAIDERNVGKFLRFDTGAQLGPQEIVIRYRVRDGTPKFATNAFFFQEGTGDLYTPARFGEFRVSPSGDAILVGMRNEKLEILGNPERR